MIPTTCSQCGGEKPETRADSYCAGCRRAQNVRWRKGNPERDKELNRESRRRAHVKEKLAAIEAYGGACTCCSEDNPHFLTVEHIGGVPDRHRWASGSRVTGLALLRRLRDEGYPDDCTILCWNCNASRAYYGFCPHQPHDQEAMFYHPHA